ncbi:MAG: YchF-related putative GTPase [Nanoarchaeota archaeon]|nr:YchF-related putative GTPase [Nanoarchaeota archaeon]
MIIGVVGKPNVGKSAFFRAATLANAESGNFPFTTIDKNAAIGYVKVKDPALDFNKHSNPRDGYVSGDYRFVPVELIDVAGLVPGAHEGKGLGNKFLDDLRQADVLIHIIDISGSTNERGESVELFEYDPINDIKFLEDELNHWYFNIIKKHWENIYKKIKMQGMKIEEALLTVLSGLKISEKQIGDAIYALSLNASNIADNLFELAVKLREFSKPMIIGANKCDAFKDVNQLKNKLKELQELFPNYIIIPTVAQYEFNLKKADEAELLQYTPGENSFEIKQSEKLSEQQLKGLNIIQEYLDEMKTTGVQDCLNKAVFDLLQMKPIFPGGAKLEDSNGNTLPDCFLMPKSTTALDFAYRLHTDFGKNFVQAINIKKKIPVGKDHVLEFGDIIEIRSGK